MLSLFLGLAAFALYLLYDINSFTRKNPIVHCFFTVGTVFLGVATVLDLYASWRGGCFSGAGDILLLIGQTFLKFRKIFLAAPVVWAAVQLAFQNMERLPESVGLNLQVDGTYAIQITRELAVWGPVVVTIFCLLLMLCSRRILTPWLVSVMTLLIPIFLWVTNVFPS